jgi:hypothetical protein
MENSFRATIRRHSPLQSHPILQADRAREAIPECLPRPRSAGQWSVHRNGKYAGDYEWSFDGDADHGAGDPAAGWNGEEPGDRNLYPEQHCTYGQHSCAGISMFYDWCHKFYTFE